MDQGLLNDTAVCIMAAWLVAVMAHLFKQPLIIAYLLAGFAVGPQGIRLITDTSSIQTISKFGLILLLFMIGLEMDLKKMFRAGTCGVGRPSTCSAARLSAYCSCSEALRPASVNTAQSRPANAATSLT